MDLRIMPPRLQDFYFGEGIERFRAFHGLAPVG
jgi:hypothetical protein